MASKKKPVSKKNKKKVVGPKPSAKKLKKKTAAGRQDDAPGHHHGDDDCEGAGPLTPQNNQANATIVPVSTYTKLDGYWNLLRNVYRPVIVQVDNITSTMIDFFILNPDDGLPFDAGSGPELFVVDLTDGDVAYPYFPSTAQLVDTSSGDVVAYLLLSCDWLDNALGADVDDYAGDKTPDMASL